MKPLPIKEKNNEGKRVTNKNIQCNKESISTSNTYSDKSNKNKNKEHITITTGRDTTTSRSYQTQIRPSKRANKIQHQRTTTAEHKRESIQVMTTVIRDRKDRQKQKDINRIS